ncbi:MAG: DNA-binding protein [Bacteroidetes bacterium]|nr:DNA-binding protein [Bacteroidota bacterium]
MKTLSTRFILLFLLFSGNVMSQPFTSPGLFHVIRLTPGSDLKKSLMDYAKTNQLSAVGVVSCTGSLKQGNLRFADAKEGSVFDGKWEIVSLTGTFNSESGHFHLSISDSTGKTIGGHLLDGCLIYTTAELILVELPQLDFKRTQDSQTGYKELDPVQK